MDDALKQQVRRARGKFAAMASTYCLGVFNDSFYRNGAMLMAISVGQQRMQGVVMVVFTVPYLLFAAPAGWLADRFSKRQVVIGAKTLELVAMGLGAVGIVTGNWWFVLVMAFVMGSQSCLFSPALNGSIPELYPKEYVVTANAVLKVVVTASILLGVSASGAALAVATPRLWGVPAGRWIVAGGVVGIAALGVLMSLGVPRRPAADPKAPFPWAGPLKTLEELHRISRDSLLALVIVVDAFAWFVGAVIIQTVNLLAMKQFGLGEAMAGYMNAAEMGGIAVGGMFAARVARGERWHRVLAPAALLMGLFMGLTAMLPMLPEGLRVPGVFVLLGATGLAGGALLIPCESFMQVRAKPHRKGAVLAAANFVIFTGLVLSGFVANELNERMRPTSVFAVLAAMSLVMGGVLVFALPGRRRS
jgi:acyl-[acyl-carrier-protein]-phospholipid O-acyltransferase / long-chain-fatty-acid--[acyl-carrier-protein] ligase